MVIVEHFGPRKKKQETNYKGLLYGELNLFRNTSRKQSGDKKRIFWRILFGHIGGVQQKFYLSSGDVILAQCGSYCFFFSTMLR